MSFKPVLPMSGVAGWLLLKRVETSMRETFSRSPVVEREAKHFADKIASIASAADLVADRRLLGVALGAFGLENEIDKRAFIRKALESDPQDPKSFVNRLVDSRYRDLAKALGFGEALGPRVTEPGFAAKVVNAYKERMFEAAIGESDNAMRLALNARRTLPTLAAEAEAGRDGAAWFKAMGDKPLREVFEAAYGLPESFGKLDVDRQREILREHTLRLFGDGSPVVFGDAANVEKLIRRYVVRNEAVQGFASQTRGAVAITLLESGTQSFASLVQSRFY